MDLKDFKWIDVKDVQCLLSYICTRRLLHAGRFARLLPCWRGRHLMCTVLHVMKIHVGHTWRMRFLLNITRNTYLNIAWLITIHISWLAFPRPPYQVFVGILPKSCSDLFRHLFIFCALNNANTSEAQSWLITVTWGANNSLDAPLNPSLWGRVSFSGGPIYIYASHVTW